MRKLLCMFLLSAFVATMSLPSVAGLEFESEDWKLNVSGYVSGVYSMTKCNNANTVTGGISCAGTNFESAVQGSIPTTGLEFGVSTMQSELDIGAIFLLTGGINSAGNTAIGQGVVDVQRLFLHFGSESIGTFKVGKEVGIFANIAYESDSSVVGGSFSPASPVTVLGQAGSGYVYPEYRAQISYETPDLGGFQGKLGVFQPISAGTASTLQDIPQFQAGVSYSWKSENLPGMLWADFLFQNHKARNLGEFAFNSVAADGGLKISIYGLELFGYGYWGSGLGTLALFFDSISADGVARTSFGGYGSAGYRIGDFKLAVKFGRSALERAGNDPVTVLKFNQTATGGLTYFLTEYLHLVAEYSNVISQNHAAAENSEYSIAAGAWIFF